MKAAKPTARQMGDESIDYAREYLLLSLSRHLDANLKLVDALNKVEKSFGMIIDSIDRLKRKWS